MKAVRIDLANGLSGAIFTCTGAFFAVQAYTLGIGSAMQMGSGFFPMLLSIVLIVLGLVLILRGLRAESEPVGEFAVRGILLILPSPIVPVFAALTTASMQRSKSAYLTNTSSFTFGRKLIWYSAPR